MDKVKTISFGAVKDYAKVKDRLNEFRQANPNGLVETTPMPQPDGSLMFKARILKDKSNPASGEATGHAFSNIEKLTKEKGFEKLETIAVGRALALLGYASDGEIASSEEMEEFNEFQSNQRNELIMEWTGRLSDAKDLAELAKIWTEVPGKIKAELLAQKEDFKKRFTTSAPIPSTPENGPKPVARKTKPVPMPGHDETNEAPNEEDHEGK